MSESESIIKQIMEKLSDINKLSVMLPIKERHDLYTSAKKHFYVAQCVTERMLKAENKERKR